MDTEAGHDPSVWRQAATELRPMGLRIPEGWGGSGASLVELGVVFEEMGRALFTSPFFGTTALAANALDCLDDEAAREEYLPGIADGTTVATATWGTTHPLTGAIT